MRILVIDNFDSFTYNLVQYIGSLGADVSVYRNNAITPDEVLKLEPDRIMISPGPGGPKEAGISGDVIRMAAGRIPVLGVCLGHQCLAEVFGGRIIRAVPVHGKTSEVEHDGKCIFSGVPNPIVVARYHSLVVDPKQIGTDLDVTARTKDGVIMGIRHRKYELEGIQFHPESFMTPKGMKMMLNFLNGRCLL